MAERDNKGRFLPGNKASPGRAKRAIEVDFHNILLDAVSATDWTKIVAKAVKDAIAGDKYAREFVANYTIGKPPQILELRAADATLLAALLKRFEAVGMSAGEVFGAMLAQIASESETVHDER